MALPEAVQRKAEEAAKLIASKKDASTTAAHTAAPATQSPAAAEIEDLKAKLAKAEQANRVLRAKYDAEVPRYAAEVKALKEEIAKLTEKLNQKAEAAELSSLSEEERELVGKPLLDVITKAAKEVATGVVESKVKPISESVNRFQRMTEAAYEATLDREVPYWRAQNEDPNFYAVWLNEIDPATGRLRNDLLQAAHAAMQGYQVAEIFRAYREGREIGAPPKSENVSPSPPVGAAQPLPTGAAAQPKTWTRAAIRQFYEELRQGKWRHRMEEARKVELEIAAAAKEGRIV